MNEYHLQMVRALKRVAIENSEYKLAAILFNAELLLREKLNVKLTDEVIDNINKQLTYESN